MTRRDFPRPAREWLADKKQLTADEMLRLARLADLMRTAPIDDRLRFCTSYSRQMDGAERQLERLTALLGLDDDDRRVA